MSEAQVEINSAEIEVPIEVKNIIETLVFASDEPMTVRMLRGIIDEANKDRQPNEVLTVNAEIIRKAVGDLNKGYAKLGSGFRIIEIAGGFVYATQDQFATWVGKLAKEKARRRLSPTAVETLAIIAYKQPITKGEVEFIRGVNVDYIINALLEKDLIHITGRQNSPGRPLLYGTTQKFLEHFGLNELSDLPKPREIAELINETEIEVDRRLLAEQQELEFRESLENKLEGHEGTAKKEQSEKGRVTGRTVRQPKVKVPDEVKAEQADKERAEQKEKTSKETVDSDQSSVISKQEPEIQTVSNTAEVPVEELRIELPIEKSTAEVEVADDETVETESVEVSPPSEIVEETIEPQSEISIEAEERIEESVEASEESAVHFSHETPNIEQEISNIEVVAERELMQPVKVFGEEGVESSIHRGSITEETEHPQHEAGRQQESEGGWSKWKNKVKTFFKKLFA